MIKETNSNPIFFILTEGDILEKEDQYYNYVTDRWCSIDSSNVGEKYLGTSGYSGHMVIIRRKNPDYVNNSIRTPWI